MGERSIVEIADALAAGIPVEDVTYINGTVYRTRSLEHVYDAVELAFVRGDGRRTNWRMRTALPCSTKTATRSTGKRLVEAYPHDVYVVQNPPAAPLTTEEMDAVYRLPYARTYHPSYEADGGVPAIKR